MKTFSTVEDYIEVIAGWRDPSTNTVPNSQNILWFNFNPIISLARYDVSVLESMCTAAMENKALTTRQGELAVKIIMKYNRQLAQKNIDVSALSDPQWRLPLRVMDYSKRLRIENDKLMAEFPFSTDLIEGLREFRKDSQGSGEWNKEKRRWEFALTEYNLVYLKTWAENNQFEIDAEVVRLNSLIELTEQAGYAIELDFVDGELIIKNASATLIEYINTHCGGFAPDNLAKLIDMSSVLGYTVNQDITNTWAITQGNGVNCLSCLREIRVNPERHTESEVLSSVVKYAELTNRYPVVLFEPDLKNVLRKNLNEIIGEDKIYIHRAHRKIGKLPDDVKYIHTTVPIKDLEIPLLISSVGMMFGGEKSLMLQNTEKAIYFAMDVYTNKKEYKVSEFES